MPSHPRRSVSRRELFALLAGRRPPEAPRPQPPPPRVPGVVGPEAPFSLEDFYRRRRDGGEP